MQRLADNGVTYPQWHTTALCSPTRSVFLTGRNHHQRLRDNRRVVDRLPGLQLARPARVRLDGDRASHIPSLTSKCQPGRPGGHTAQQGQYCAADDRVEQAQVAEHLVHGRPPIENRGVLIRRPFG